jgi:hypothetical protein
MSKKVDLDRGRIAVQEMQAQLISACQAKLLKLGMQAPEIQKTYDISKVDLYSVVSGKGTIPFARLVMFAANLGYDVDLVVSEK